MPWWDKQPGLHDLEVALILSRYPEASVEKRSEVLVVTTEVKIPVSYSRKPVCHSLEVQATRNYPRVAPKVYVKDIRFPRKTQGMLCRPKHLHFDDSLCLFYPKDPRSLRWLPEDGILTIMVWAERWLAAYYVWKYRNRWPGKSAH